MKSNNLNQNFNAICKIRVVHKDRIEIAHKKLISNKKIEQISSIFKMLGDPTRMKIMMALAEIEMCVCDLAAFLNLTESAVSHQLRRLKDLALVKYRRDGQIFYYSLSDDQIANIIKVALNYLETRNEV
jgi:ArsR family transcriptional regulator, lead/cadmium/zinc/bismuth-responsive transcriptional repressor